jgi:HK97 family phage prohead protease/HK97 family phage major capsid protein
VIRFSAPIAAASDGTGRREISGVAAPYGVDAIVSDGTAVRFEVGALPEDGPAPKLIESHDLSQIRGIVTERVNTDEGMMFTARIAPTAAGNDALELVKMGAIDSVSVGVTPTKWHMDGDTMVIEAADWMELSLVAIPAFAGATINQVAAQAAPEPTPTVSEEEAPMANEPQVEATAPATIPTIPTAPIYATVRKPRLPSPGEYLFAMKRGGSEFAQLNANIAAEIQAAQGDVLVSDAAGVIPTPILGPVYDAINPLRPIVTALGARAMPDAGATFIRPYVKVRAAVAEQANELANLTNADFEVDDIVITKKTFGGRLYLSEQVIDWSSPSMLDQAITDMAGQYALATEKHVVDRMAAAITNTQEVVITSFTDADEVVTDLYLAAASIAATGNYLPNAIVVSPTRWAALGALKDGDDRPLFPIGGPVNSAGQLPQGVTGWNGNILGLTLVVSNQVGTQVVGNATGGGYTAKTASEYMWLLNTRGVEVYENYKGFLRDDNVSQLGVNIAVRGYFAAHVIDVNMIRILGPDATFA